MSFTGFVARRYSKPARGSGLSGFLTLVSLLGLVLGVSSLIIVSSVMNGFERELHNRLLGLLPHAELVGDSVMGEPSQWQPLLDALPDQAGVEAAAPYIEQTVMLRYGSRQSALQLLGVDVQREADVSAVSGHIVAGDFEALGQQPWGIVLGALTARTLGVAMGDSIELLVPRLQVTPFGLQPRSKRFTVVAVFEVGAELDQGLAMIELGAAQRLLAMRTAVSGIRLRVDDQYRARRTGERALQSLSSQHNTAALRVIDWREQNASLFQAVQMEKIMVFIMLMAVVAVACFNIVSIILMTVTDKRGDIAVLRTMGASARQIQQLFIKQGLVIGTVGTLCGALLGVLVAPNVGAALRYVEQASGWQLFDPSVYYIPYLPSSLDWGEVGIVVITALLLSLLSTLVPAGRAASIQPAEALSYEH